MAKQRGYSRKQNIANAVSDDLRALVKAANQEMVREEKRVAQGKQADYSDKYKRAQEYLESIGMKKKGNRAGGLRFSEAKGNQSIADVREAGKYRTVEGTKLSPIVKKAREQQTYKTISKRFKNTYGKTLSREDWKTISEILGNKAFKDMVRTLPSDEIIEVMIDNMSSNINIFKSDIYTEEQAELFEKLTGQRIFRKMTEEEKQAELNDLIEVEPSLFGKL